jgi:hypothetical protein
MKLRELLMEGGKAVKMAEPLTQEEAKQSIPNIVKKVAKSLNIRPSLIKVLGSAGKKPQMDDLSGDIDLGVQCDTKDVEAALSELAYDGRSFKVMAGINTYSFGEKIQGGKIVQVDLLPVKNLEYAAWSYIADPRDLKRGLKGADRNEILFAVVRWIDVKEKKNDEGEVISIERYYFDLNKGLMRGKQSREGKGDKLKKNLSTIGEKKLVSDDPKVIAHKLFGMKYAPDKLLTFGECWNAIHDPDFPGKDHLETIIKMIKKGIEDKNLPMPSEVEDAT